MNNISLYTIGYIGFDHQEQESISAIIDLGHLALNCTWAVSDGAESDVKMINLDCEDGRKQFSDKNNRSNCTAIYVAAEPHADIKWFLRKKKDSPPSLKELAQLLNEIELLLSESPKEVVELEKSSETDGEIKPEPVIDSKVEGSIEAIKNIAVEGGVKNRQEVGVSEEKTNPVETPLKKKAVKQKSADHKSVKKPEPKKKNQQKLEDREKIEPVFSLDSLDNNSLQVETRSLTDNNYLFGLLLTSKKDKKCRAIISSGLPTLYLSPKKDSYYFAGTEDELMQLCVVDPRQFNDTVMTTTKFDHALKNEEDLMTFEGFDALIGYAVLNASQGRLLAKLSAEKPVKLVQYPDIIKVPVLKRYEEISALMHDQEEISLLGVVEKLQVNLPYVFDYFNICYLLGYLEVIKRVENEMDASSDKSRSFFTTFFKK